MVVDIENAVLSVEGPTDISVNYSSVVLYPNNETYLTAYVTTDLALDKTAKEIEAEISNYIVKNNISAKVVLGGETRQESVSHGLKECDGEFVIIHDGARPLIDDKVIADVLKAAKECGASTVYIPETDTVTKIGKDGFAEETLDRNLVAKIQTPQAFKLDVINEAHKCAKDNKATDDASLVKALGNKVALVLGSKKLTKITTVEDIKYLEGLLK